MPSPIIARFSQHATTYDQDAQSQAQIFDQLLHLAPKRATHILDFGCGTGRNTLKMSQYYPDSRVDAYDPANGMIQVAKTQHPHPHITYHTTIPTPHTPYDLIISNACLHWIDTPVDTLQKWTQILHPQGQILFSYYTPDTFKELENSIQAAFPQTPHIVSQRFTAIDDILAYCQAHFHHVHHDTTQQEHVFPSLIALLKNIRNTGTHARSRNGLWTPQKLQKIEAAYLKEYGEIRASTTAVLVRAHGLKMEAAS